MPEEFHDQDAELHKEAEMIITKKPTNSFFSGVFWGVGVIIILGIIGGLVGAYRYPDSVPVFPKILAAVHAPAAFVSGAVISWSDVAVESGALSNYIKNQGGPALGANEIRQRVLHRLFLTKVAEKAAKEKNLAITDDAVNKEIDSLVERLGGKEKVVQEIQKQYGWSLETYRDRVVRPMMLLDALEKKFNDDVSINAAAREKIEKAKAEIDGGASFEEVAKKYGEDATAEVGGDLGDVKRGTTVQQFEDVIFAATPGKVTDIFQTRFGWHIAKVESVKMNKAKEVESVRVRHIVARFKTLQDVLQERLAVASVWQLLKTTPAAREALDTAAPGE